MTCCCPPLPEMFEESYRLAKFTHDGKLCWARWNDRSLYKNYAMGTVFRPSTRTNFVVDQKICVLMNAAGEGGAQSLWFVAFNEFDGSLAVELTDTGYDLADRVFTNTFDGAALLRGEAIVLAVVVPTGTANQYRLRRIEIDPIDGSYEAVDSSVIAASQIQQAAVTPNGTAVAVYIKNSTLSYVSVDPIGELNRDEAIATALFVDDLHAVQAVTGDDVYCYIRTNSDTPPDGQWWTIETVTDAKSAVGAVDDRYAHSAASEPVMQLGIADPTHFYRIKDGSLTYHDMSDPAGELEFTIDPSDADTAGLSFEQIAWSSEFGSRSAQVDASDNCYFFAIDAPGARRIGACTSSGTVVWGNVLKTTLAGLTGVTPIRIGIRAVGDGEFIVFGAWHAEIALPTRPFFEESYRYSGLAKYSFNGSTITKDWEWYTLGELPVFPSAEDGEALYVFDAGTVTHSSGWRKLDTEPKV